MTNYLIIHGSFGTPYNNWFPWLHNHLMEKGKHVIVPYFPYGKNYQNFENWANLLDSYRKSKIFNSSTVVIAHSIGCAFIAKYILERHMIISKLILVAPFNNYSVDGGDYDYVNKTFYTDNLEVVKDYTGEIVCVYSDNDPYVKQEACKDFADIVKAKEIIIPNGGHLNSESGYNSFEEILKNISN